MCFYSFRLFFQHVAVHASTPIKARKYKFLKRGEGLKRFEHGNYVSTKGPTHRKEQTNPKNVLKTKFMEFEVPPKFPPVKQVKSRPGLPLKLKLKQPKISSNRDQHDGDNNVTQKNNLQKNLTERNLTTKYLTKNDLNKKSKQLENVFSIDNAKQESDAKRSSFEEKENTDDKEHMMGNLIQQNKDRNGNINGIFLKRYRTS